MTSTGTVVPALNSSLVRRADIKANMIIRLLSGWSHCTELVRGRAIRTVKLSGTPWQLRYVQAIFIACLTLVFPGQACESISLPDADECERSCQSYHRQHVYAGSQP